MSDRYGHLRGALGPDGFKAVQESRLLIVGAGGIGCELIKNLVLSGFQDMEIIDLDTIDVSNLNRQFLFRNRHVGMSKSLVAREAALEFNPDVKIVSHHGNIKADEFGLAYFKKFDLVLNALDNVNARQHVNRLCLAADIPLIDSGTTGYLGQTNVHKRGETMCYDCQPKTENKKTFPICTIRNTPDKPVHCIVWAKELFKLMFGNMEESMLSGQEPTAAEEGGEGEGKTEAENVLEKEMEIRSIIMDAAKRLEGADMDDEEKLEAYAKGMFEAVFNNEIKLKLKLRDGYKGAKKKPAPLSFEEAMKNTATSSAPGTLRDQRVLSLKECTDLFVNCVKKMYAPDRRATIGDAVFDKDDDLTLDFVTATSNLRCHIFSIERKSKFDVKGIAGNIIHAIATTNAIVAGIQVMEAIKLLCRIKKAALKPSYSSKSLLNDTDEKITKDSRAVWVVREPIGTGFLLQALNLHEPNPKCYSCGNAVLTLMIDVENATLGDVVENVLKKKLGVNSPSIMMDSSEIYLEGQGLEDDEVEFFQANLAKKLKDCPAGGIKDGRIVEVEDFSQNMKFQLIFNHKVFDPKENPDQFDITGDTPVVSKDEQEEDKKPNDDDDDDVVATGGAAPVDDDDVVLLVEQQDDPAKKKNEKRTASQLDDQSNNPNKRNKT